MDLQPSIRIIPTAHPAPDGAARSWEIKILNGQQVLERTIKDPFNDAQHDECQWYLDRYAQNDSLHKGRATNIEWHLRKYGKSLVSQLGIDVTEGSDITLEICEIDLEEEASKSTIHRICWELLEDASAWGLESLCLRVRRMRSSDASHEYRVSSMLLEKPKVINILHIVARDGDDSDDVNPVMSLSILADLNRELKARKAGVELNIESVKPATLKQLSRHLLTVRGEGRHRDIHIIHLDVHGAADISGASLYLEDTKRKTTTPQASAKLASRFNNNEVAAPYLILNACQSAVARYGDFANTAKVFGKMGCAENVLAMSFTALETAATMFLKTFYTQIFLRGEPFGRAAHAARRILRENNLRDARFNRQVSLMDWFSPVVYSSVQDTAIILPISVEEETIPTPLQKSDVVEQVYGRDYDLNNLERLVNKSRMVYIYGHAWIGKSTFLRYAQRIWEQTSLAGKIVYVDCSNGRIQDCDSLAATILEQLSVSDIQKGNEKKAVLEHISSTQKVLIIIDCLHTIFSSFGKDLVPLALDDNVAKELDTFLKNLTDACDTGGKESSIILCGRCPPAPKLRSQQPETKEQAFHVCLDARFKVMELEELAPADALLLCKESIQADDSSSLSFIDGSMLLSRLLLGNPGVISALCATARSNKIEIGELTTRLHRGDSELYQSISVIYTQGGTLDEFNDMLGGLEPDELFALLFIGLFWHQCLYTVTFANAMVSFGVCGNEETVNRIVAWATERGYIRTRRVQNLERISFIHPAFTLYCRIILHGFCQTGSDKEDEVRSKRLSRAYPHVVPSHLIEAAKSFSAIFLEKDFTKPSVWSHITWFLQDIDDQRTFALATEHNVGLGRRIQPNHLANHFQNALACLRICRDDNLGLPAELWPLGYMMQICIPILAAGTPNEVKLFIHQYDILLDHLFKIAPELMESDWELQRFATMITVNMLLMFRMQNLSTREPQAWMNRINAILSARQCDAPTEDDAVFLLAQRMCDMMTNKFDQYDVNWQGFFQHVKGYQDKANQSGQNYEQLADIIPRALKRGPDGVKEARSMLQNTPYPFVQVTETSVLDVAMCLTPKAKAAQEVKAGKDDVSASKSVLATESKATPNRTVFDQGNFKDLLKLVSETHLGHQKHEIPVNSLFGRHLQLAFEQCQNIDNLNDESVMAVYQNETTGMDLIEVATNSGDWASAIQSHCFLMDAARISGNIPLVSEHIDELLRLLHSINDPKYADNIKLFSNIKQQLDSLHTAVYDVDENNKMEKEKFQRLATQSQSFILDNIKDPIQHKQMKEGFAATNALADKVSNTIPFLHPDEWSDFQKSTAEIYRTEDSGRVLELVCELATLKNLAIEARSKDDIPTAIHYCRKLEKIYAEDKVAAFIEGPDFAKIRPQLSWPMEWYKTFKDLQASVNAKDWDNAEKHFKVFTGLIEELRSNPAFQEMPAEERAQRELEYEASTWIYGCYRAVGHWDKAPATVLKALEEALSHPAEFYSRISKFDEEEVRKTLQLAVTCRARCILVLMAGRG